MKRKHAIKAIGAAVSALVASPLWRRSHPHATPAPGYEQFAGCPTKAEKPDTSTCIRSTVTGGRFKIGNKEVPITSPIVLSGGTNRALGNVGANSKGGLTVVKQKVPGGVIGLTGLTWLAELLGSEALRSTRRPNWSDSQYSTV